MCILLKLFSFYHDVSVHGFERIREIEKDQTQACLSRSVVHVSEWHFDRYRFGRNTVIALRILTIIFSYSCIFS